jgi:hypothetical protein
MILKMKLYSLLTFFFSFVRKRHRLNYTPKGYMGKIKGRGGTKASSYHDVASMDTNPLQSSALCLKRRDKDNGRDP